MKMPDFKQWGLKLTSHHTLHSAENVAEALKQAFDQGYYYGLNYGWADEQDKIIRNLEEAFPVGCHTGDRNDKES